MRLLGLAGPQTCSQQCAVRDHEPEMLRQHLEQPVLDRRQVQLPALRVLRGTRLQIDLPDADVQRAPPVPAAEA